jgi:hypothetical protein
MKEKIRLSFERGYFERIQMDDSFWLQKNIGRGPRRKDNVAND